MTKGRVKSTTGLNLRLKPNGDKIGVLSHNAEFDIIDEVTFYRVRTATGVVGYVHSDYVEKTPSSAQLPETLVIDEDAFNPEFTLVNYTHERFMGEAVKVDHGFVPSLERVAQYAAQCNLKIWVTSSIRQLDNQIQGAIVKPAGHSCHHVGHAIDMNIFYNETLYNSKKLRRHNHQHLPANIVAFFDLIRADRVLRWGGDFTTEDPVHIDDNFYNKQKLMYLAKLDSRIKQLNA